MEVRQETEVHFLVGTVILGFLSIFKRSKALSPLSIELHVLLEGSNGSEAPCPDEADTCGFL